MENKQLTPEQSLDVIRQMVDATRERYERGAGTIFLIWGYTSFLVTLLLTSLKHFCPTNHNVYWLWFLIPVVGWAAMYFYKRGHEKPVTTYIDRFINTVWRVIGVFATLLPILGIFSNLAWFYVIPVETVLLCIGVIITGLTIKVRVLTVGGILATLSSIAMLLCQADYAFLYMYFFMFTFVAGMVIPGHILNYRGRCLKS